MRRIRAETAFFLLIALLAIAATAIMVPRANAQTSTWPLVWTAPGDDGNAGTATSIKVFYSATLPDSTGLTAWLNAYPYGGLIGTTPAGIQTWINQASNVTGPTPLAAGSVQAFTIQGTFLAGVKYWAMITTCDEAGNCARSNFAVRTVQTVDTWPPRAVLDLRTGP